MDKTGKDFKLSYCKFYRDNLYEVFENLKKVFKIDINDFEYIINYSIEGLEKDFFKEALKDVNLRQCYSIDSLHKLVDSFKSVNIDAEQIKQIIVQYPEMITFSIMTDNIQYLFKANDLKAIVLIFNEKYDYHLIDMYSLMNDLYYDYKIKDVDIMNNVKNLKIYPKNIEKIYNKKIKLYDTSRIDYFGELLEILEREDIRKYYKLDDASKLADKINALEEDFNKREVYIKKKK